MVDFFGRMRLREARVDRSTYYSDNNYTCIEYLPSTIYVRTIYGSAYGVGGKDYHPS